MINASYKNLSRALDFVPLIPEIYLYIALAFITLFIVLSAFHHQKGLVWRTIGSACFILLLLNPSFIEEQREAIPDIAVIAVDKSHSQSYGARTEKTDKALTYLQEELSKKENLEIRTIYSDTGAQDTRLFSAIDQSMTDIPLNQRAGVILLTDGQVHDVPQNNGDHQIYGPVHSLLTGAKNEQDRQLVIVEAPSYGIVGQKVNLRYRVTDTHAGTGDYATVSIRQPNTPTEVKLVPVNEDQFMPFEIKHAGQNVFDIEASGKNNEITMANNRVPLIINGVRDRLRVLLVSGQPHAGGRTWRNLLKSDPGVDLVHFTILREPQKRDITPQKELSLIAFPFKELFEVKLYDFDLIIFDRYGLNRILPTFYFKNIARYVEKGGALLEASGPSFAGTNSIYTTDLGIILPGRPTGQVIESAFKPAITDKGRRHPVTENLGNGDTDNPAWGSWLRQIAINPISGHTLMTGTNDLPLLVLDRVGKGRVAQLSSDQIWLWARGYEGGGPHSELLRRLAHWLMKEPELEENALSIIKNNKGFTVRRRSLNTADITIKVTAPDNALSEEILKDNGKGQLETFIEAQQLGVYTIDDGTQTRFVLNGDAHTPELQAVITTDDKLKNIAQNSKGSTRWLADSHRPNIKQVTAGRRYSGSNWLGLRKNNSYNVTGIKSRSLLPPGLYVLILLGTVLGCWWREGRQR